MCKTGSWYQLIGNILKALSVDQYATNYYVLSADSLSENVCTKTCTNDILLTCRVGLGLTLFRGDMIYKLHFAREYYHFHEENDFFKGKKKELGDWLWPLTKQIVSHIVMKILN